MGIIGKYVIELIFKDGTKGLFMEIMEGRIALTNNVNAACRFLTYNGAKGFYEEIQEMRELEGGSYIKEAYIDKCNKF